MPSCAADWHVWFCCAPTHLKCFVHYINSTPQHLSLKLNYYCKMFLSQKHHSCVFPEILLNTCRWPSPCSFLWPFMKLATLSFWDMTRIYLSHEITVLFILHKLIWQMCVRSHPVTLDVWFLSTSILHVCKQREPSLVAYVIISWAGSFIRGMCIYLFIYIQESNLKVWATYWN